MLSEALHWQTAFQQLAQEIDLGYEQALQGELHDGEQVFEEIRKELAPLLTMARLGLTEQRFAWLRAQEQSLAKVWDNEEDSVFDHM